MTTFANLSFTGTPLENTPFEERLHRLQRQRDHALRGYERKGMTPQLSEALRSEIRTALEADGKPFDVNVARRVYDLAIAARDMCVAATSGVKEAIATIKDVGGPIESLDTEDTPESQVQASESFGARLLRELMASLPMMQQRRDGDDPKQLVHALAEARRTGMHDVAEELEKKLFGRVMLGSRPVGTGIEVPVGSFEHGFADGRANSPPFAKDGDYHKGYLKGLESRYLVPVEPSFDHSKRITKYFDRDMGLCVCSDCQRLPEHEPITVQSLTANTDIGHAPNCLARSYGEERECNCHRSKRLVPRYDDTEPRYDDTELRGRPSNRVPMDPVEREELEGK